MASLFVRTYTFVDGTTAYGSQVEAEIASIVSVLNSLDAATTNWTNVSVLNATAVPLIADCSSGSQHIADFKNNSVIKASISSAGLGTFVGVNAGSAKVTAVANGTAATDAAAFGQVKLIQVTSVNQQSTNFSTTSSSFQTTNCTGTITPTSASNRIKITVTGTGVVAASNQSCLLTIARGTTDLSASGLGFCQILGVTSGEMHAPVCITVIDSPATTSATTYNVRIKNTNNATTVQFGNGLDTVMILEEIV